jgi:hypothetical protein
MLICTVIVQTFLVLSHQAQQFYHIDSLHLLEQAMTAVVLRKTVKATTVLLP